MAMSNYSKALAILNGTTVIAHDRRKSDAPKIDFEKKVVRSGKSVFNAVRTAYGVSNRTHEALAKLAKRVEVVSGRFVYYYAA